MAEPLPRVDPPSRSVDGSTNAKITNKDPNRVYRLANPNDEETGVEYLLTEGYMVEKYRKDGPRIVGGKTAAEGSAIMFRGQVLMSCPAEVEMARYQAGQDRAALIDQQILKPGGIDGVRGGSGRLATNLSTHEVEFSRS